MSIKEAVKVLGTLSLLMGVVTAIATMNSSGIYPIVAAIFMAVVMFSWLLSMGTAMMVGGSWQTLFITVLVTLYLVGVLFFTSWVVFPTLFLEFAITVTLFSLPSLAILGIKKLRQAWE